MPKDEVANAPYSREEVEAILDRALRARDLEGLSHEELVEAAREIGIDPSQIDEAALEVREADAVVALEQSLLQQQRRDFGRHLLTYLVVNAFLFAMNTISGGTLWVWWVILGWGLGVALQGVKALFPDRAALNRKARRHLEREARRRQKEERKRRGRQAAAGFESAVEAGVTALVDAIGRNIRESLDESRGAPRGGTVGRGQQTGRSAPAGSPPRSRVSRHDEPAPRAHEAARADDLAELDERVANALRDRERRR